MVEMMETKQPAGIRIVESDPDSLKSVYVARMERLLRLRQEHEPELNSQGIRLLDRAIFAAFCACREAGVEDKAKLVLRKANISLRQPTSQLQLPGTDELPRTGTEG